jgi:hypothetical protein
MSFKHTAINTYLTEVFTVDIVSRSTAHFTA